MGAIITYFQMRSGMVRSYENSTSADGKLRDIKNYLSLKLPKIAGYSCPKYSWLLVL